MVAHLLLMAACAIVADVTTPGTLWVGACAYALLQGGRALHEFAHFWAAQRTGMRVRQLRFGVIRMAVDFPHGAVWSAETSARKRTALAGSLAQAAFGVLLIAGAVVRQSSHAAEPVLLIGLLHAAAVTNLLPVRGSDGEFVFGAAWQLRPAWLPLLPVVLAQLALPVLVTVAVFPHGTVQAYAGSLAAPSQLVYAAVALLIALPLTQRLISASNSADSRAYISSVARGVR